MNVMNVTERAESHPGVGRIRWTIVALLFAATSINYMDRFILGILKPTIVRELHWSEIDYGNVVFCFQLAYAIGLLVMSRIVDRLGTRRGMMLVVGLCAIAAASHSIVTSLAGFCLARLLLGFGEAGTWPGCAKAVSEWLPRKERAVGMGFVNAGSSVGATLMPLLVPVVLLFVPWPMTFLLSATLDAIWVAVWFMLYRAPSDHPRLGAAERDYIRAGATPAIVQIPWWRLFRYRQAWAFLIAKGLTDPVWWFYLFWVPGFLAKTYFPTVDGAAQIAALMAMPVIVIYLMADVGSIGGGAASLWLIERGWTINAARKTVMLVCALCVTPVFLVTHQLGLWPSVLLIGLAAAAHLGFSANLFTIATDTVPRNATSSVAGIGGMAAAVAGMFVAKFVGYILDKTGSYALPFALASAAYLLALAAVHLLLPRLESIGEPSRS